LEDLGVLWQQGRLDETDSQPAFAVGQLTLKFETKGKFGSFGKPSINIMLDSWQGVFESR